MDNQNKGGQIIDVLFEFHLNFWNTASIGIPVRCSKVDRPLTAQLKGRTARWYSNKTSLVFVFIEPNDSL